MSLSIPRHRASHDPCVISAMDTAWDRDRVAAEIEAHPDEPHPVTRYLQGETRFDLDAQIPWQGDKVSVRDYLAGDPTVFVIRKLRATERARVQDMVAGRRVMETLLEAARLGLESVRGGGDFEVEHTGGRVSEATMGDLMDVGGGEGVDGKVVADLAYEIGAKVMRYAEALTDAEKKR